MGIPKQVLEAEAEADANIKADAGAEKAGAKFSLNAGQTPPQPTHPTQAEPPPKPETADTPKQTKEQPKPLSEKDLQRMRSMLGRLGKTQGVIDHKNGELEKLNEEVQKLREEKETLSRRFEEAEKSAQKVAAKSPTGDQLAKVHEILNRNGADYTDEEVATFAEAFGAIADFHNRGITEEIEKAKADKLNAKAEQFKARLEQEFPGFAEIDSGDDPVWVQFLSGDMPEPYSGMTIEQFAQDAINQMDYRSFSWVVRQFYATRGQFAPGVPKGSSGEVWAQVRPSGARETVVGKNQNQRMVVPRSDIDQFRVAYYAKKAGTRYGLDAKQVEERLAFYEEAEANDRVDETR